MSSLGFWSHKGTLYVPGGKGAPVFVKFCLYPNFGVPHVGLAHNHSHKVDKVMMLWNNKDTAVL